MSHELDEHFCHTNQTKIWEEILNLEPALIFGFPESGMTGKKIQCEYKYKGNNSYIYIYIYGIWVRNKDLTLKSFLHYWIYILNLVFCLRNIYLLVLFTLKYSNVNILNENLSLFVTHKSLRRFGRGDTSYGRLPLRFNWTPEPSVSYCSVLNKDVLVRFVYYG